ncbi:methylated-DNA--[protein]-cysteine S-methyltransferase [Rubrivirga sp. S365]|uniref:methylated-DNA--[protein]-cysteine S-methyltransferase n=1 Tax=Rubrivirga sp. S365 TaxID=3076080 RepID=UPI0028C8162F|nr:methylated-DNA--[protein]-cysteine S-methyltransferase [Rubrivirga sp. S365]MDT7855449.1 methylated-DNA--[protein]-cysteine S-methyltransferase [Rubrivirga sp. S365]
MRRTLTVATPLGLLLLTADRGALVGAAFDADEGAPTAAPSDAEADALLAAAAAELRAYFGGSRAPFTVPVRPEGTPFQERVWAALREVPHGETVGYGALAARLGDRGAAQAVGAANGQNPVAVVVPCHRVVGADGSLVGYAGGLARKRALLDLESRQGRLF